MLDIICGDALTELRKLPSDSVHCCVCSPPYFGLRDYGTGTWDGGDPACDHLSRASRQTGLQEILCQRGAGGTLIKAGGHKAREPEGYSFRDVCGKCGARRVDQQIGIEESPDLWVARLVEVFREVRRVLRPDGVCFVNVGDAYATGGGRSCGRNDSGKEIMGRAVSDKTGGATGKRTPAGYKNKDLIGQPWMLAFALRADGWFLRSEILWAKNNPMPESVRDRPTKAHEQVFLLVKGERKSRVIKFADLDGQRFHFGQHIGPQNATLEPVALCVELATTIFDRAQRQEGFRLPPFYAEEWKQGAGGEGSDFVRGLPIGHRATAGAARFLMAQTTAKEFLHELGGLQIALTDSGNLLVLGIDTEIALTPSVTSDREAPVAVHYAGKVGKLDFLHACIILEYPSRATYFYDAEAVREPSYGGSRSVLGAKNYRGTNGREWEGGAETYDEAAGRNLRSVWTIATDPLPNVVVGGTYRIESQDCSVHGCPADRDGAPRCGAPQVASDPPRSLGIDADPVEAQEGVAYAIAEDQYGFLSAFPAAMLRSRQIHRMAFGSEPDGFASDTSVCHTDGTSPYRQHSAISAHNHESSTSAALDGDGMGSCPSARNHDRIYGIATSEPRPNGCSCQYIGKTRNELAHFASYPVELARRCILAGTSAKGCCPECGAPWARVVERPAEKTILPSAGKTNGYMDQGLLSATPRTSAFHGPGWRKAEPDISITTGWNATCDCCEICSGNMPRPTHTQPHKPFDPIPCRVLDPFGGSGRTALAAEELQRDCTLIELNPASVKMAHAQIERAKARRMIGDAERVPVAPGQLPLL